MYSDHTSVTIDKVSVLTPTLERATETRDPTTCSKGPQAPHNIETVAVLQCGLVANTNSNSDPLMK